MIITDISAQNFLKYENIEYKDLPESGVIAIAGPNESGKSTIGETICFALFGRTFSLDEGELEKLIRWDESRCSVQLRFRTNDGLHYEVSRFIDRDGNLGARLGEVDDESPIARGVDEVNQAMVSRLGLVFDAFVDSFYLAQREITTPHPHSHAVKAMAGITSFEAVGEAYDQEIERERTAIEAREAEAQGINAELEELDIDPDALDQLKQEQAQACESVERLEQQTDALEHASSNYQLQMPQLERTRRKRGRGKFLRLVMFLLTLVLAGAWGALTRMADHPLSLRVKELLVQQVPQWSDIHIPWLLYGAIGCGLLFLLLWIRIASLSGRMRTLRQSADALADLLTPQAIPLPEIPATLDADTEESEATEEASHQPDPQPEVKADVSSLSSRVARCVATPSEVRDGVGHHLAGMRGELNRQQGLRRTLSTAVIREEQRLVTSELLTTTYNRAIEHIDEHDQRIYLRELGQELLAGASRTASQHFNRDLRDLVSRTLPLFTEGRYEHLQIDEDLTVRVFSSEKRDFLDLEEISSGTQRQIMLAVRLALSQKLINNRIKGKQFIFLDEPFAFFDQERTRSSLEALPKLSDDIEQIWIVAQSFPENQSFDFPITCDRDNVQLPAADEIWEKTPQPQLEASGFTEES